MRFNCGGMIMIDGDFRALKKGLSRQRDSVKFFSETELCRPSQRLLTSVLPHQNLRRLA